MNELNLNTKFNGSGDLKNKCKIYISYHPKDYPLFEYYSDLLLKKKDIAIYYFNYTKDDPLHVKDDLLSALNSMRLIVIPITAHYLNEKNFAFEHEFSFAVNNRIPILPIISDPCLINRFNEKCGNLQGLCEVRTAPSEVSFDEKLDNYLNSVILNGHQIQNIKNAFKALLFLSYRKKDRDTANKLIKQIHNDDRLLDVAIWFDEFLTAGEPFDNEIRNEITNCDLFSVLVTNNTFEPGNYVIEYEIPFAKEKNKEILLIKSEETDMTKSCDSLSGFKTVTSNDFEKLNNTIARMIPQTIQHEHDKYNRQFYLALAYLSGISTTRDPEKAVTLLEKSAGNSNVNAMRQLFFCYKNGDGVTVDLSKAVFWLKKTNQTLKQLYFSTKRIEYIKEVIKTYYDLLDCYESLEQDYNFQVTMDECVALFESIEMKPSSVHELYFFILQRAVIFELNHSRYESALEISYKMLSIAIGLASIYPKHEVLVINTYLLLFEIFDQTKNQEGVRIYSAKIESYIDCKEKECILPNETLAEIYYVLSTSKLDVISNEKKKEYLDKAVPLYEQLYKYNPSQYLERYIKILNRKTIDLSIDEKEQKYLLAIDLIQNAFSKNPYERRRLYANECWKIADFYIREKEDYRRGELYLKNAKDQYEALSILAPTQYLIDLAGIHDTYNILCTKTGDFSGAETHCEREEYYLNLIDDGIQFDKKRAFSDLYMGMANMYIREKRYEDAMRYIDKALGSWEGVSPNDISSEALVLLSYIPEFMDEINQNLEEDRPLFAIEIDKEFVDPDISSSASTENQPQTTEVLASDFDFEIPKH